MPPARDPVERFWEKVEKTETCWLWTGSQTKSGNLGNGGYGQLHLDGRPVRAHRFAYELLVGPIPASMLICHSCDTPPCVNPEHLFPGTKKTNAIDMSRKGRSPHSGKLGDANPKRSPERRARREEVLRLHAQGVRPTEIGRRTGMTRSNVYHIVTGRSWT